jgi:hypothetical protein
MTAAYTKKESEDLVELYLKNPGWDGVLECAKKFKRTPRSVVAKLSKEGVYNKTGYVDKLGRPPVTKLHLVTEIEKLLDVSLPDLDKAPKETLRTLHKEIDEVVTMAGNVAQDLLEQEENRLIQEEMRRVASK